MCITAESRDPSFHHSFSVHPESGEAFVVVFAVFRHSIICIPVVTPFNHPQTSSFISIFNLSLQIYFIYFNFDLVNDQNKSIQVYHTLLPQPPSHVIVGSPNHTSCHCWRGRCRPPSIATVARSFHLCDCFGSARSCRRSYSHVQLQTKDNIWTRNDGGL